MSKKKNHTKSYFGKHNQNSVQNSVGPEFGKFILSKLTATYPLVSSQREKWLTSLSLGGIVFVFLSIYQPFGLFALQKQKFLIIAGYGLITFALAFLNFWAIEKMFKESTWVVWKYIVCIIWTTFMISFFNYFYTVNIIGRVKYTLTDFIFYTYSVSIFPSVMLILINQKRLYTKYFKAAESLNEKVQKEGKNNVFSKETLTLSGMYNTTASLSPYQILYVESLANYVVVHYEENDCVQSIKLRSTLKHIWQQLDKYKIFFQPHRAFIINLNQIEHVSGNSQGLKLQIKSSASVVPVSRNLMQKFNDTLKQPYLG